MSKTRKHRKSRKHRKNPRSNPLGPLTGYPWTAGILAWVAAGAVGQMILLGAARHELSKLPPGAPPGPDTASARARLSLLSAGLFAGQVVGAIAAYKAAKTPSSTSAVSA